MKNDNTNVLIKSGNDAALAKAKFTFYTVKGNANNMKANLDVLHHYAISAQQEAIQKVFWFMEYCAIGIAITEAETDLDNGVFTKAPKLLSLVKLNHFTNFVFRIEYEDVLWEKRSILANYISSLPAMDGSVLKFRTV